MTRVGLTRRTFCGAKVSLFAKRRNLLNFKAYGQLDNKQFDSFSFCCTLSRMADDILLPRDAGKYIAENSRDVEICQNGVKNVANHVLDLLKNNRKQVDVNRWKLAELNPKTEDQAAVDWVFFTDLLNFSFWMDEGAKYMVNRHGKTWTGYWSLCAAVNRALEEGIPITDPKYYSSNTMDTLKQVFRSDSKYEMPLLDKRLENLHQAGKVLTEKYDGTFLNMVRKSNKSALKLVDLVLEEFPSFRDITEFAGKKVAIYKRVQILVADTWACCGGQGYGEFHDIDSLTMFADYRIPQILVWMGAMKYSDSALEILEKEKMLEYGETLEVEIRGCSIWAVELIIQELRKMIKSDVDIPDDMQMNSVIIDHYLWDLRQEKQTECASVPFHRTRSIYY